MKKLITIIVSLLVCASMLSVIPAVYADEIDTTVPPVETTQQETTPPEEEALPAIWDPQSEEVND